MASLLRAENYRWLLSCWFAHLSAFKVKAGAGWFAPFNPRHWHSSLLCCSQVHVPSRLLCILDGLSSPQQNHWGAGRLTEPWLCLWAITNFSPSTQGLPCGSCPALNSGTACKVNCCPTQLLYLSNLHLACHYPNNQSLCSLMMFIKACWLPFQLDCTIQCFWQDFFLREKPLHSCWIWRDLPRENKKSTLRFRNRIKNK